MYIPRFIIRFIIREFRKFSQIIILVSKPMRCSSSIFSDDFSVILFVVHDPTSFPCYSQRSSQVMIKLLFTYYRSVLCILFIILFFVSLLLYLPILIKYKHGVKKIYSVFIKILP